MNCNPKIVRSCLAGLCSLVAAISLSGCNTVPGQVNTAIAAKLPSMLGPADNYTVTSQGDIFELMRGKLRKVHIHGTNVQLSPLLMVDTFDADASDIHANVHTDAITSIGNVTFQAQFVQANMDAYLLAAQPDKVAHGAKITLDGQTITYSDNVGVWNLRTPFSVTGILISHPGNPAQLDFVPSNASLSHIRVPKAIVKYLAARQNPVVDLSQMKYPVAITSSSVVDSKLTIQGSVNLSSLVGTAPADATGGQ